MAKPDLSRLTFAELKEVIADAQQWIERKRVQEMNEARAKLRQVASEYGFSVEELMSGRAAQAAEAPKKRRAPEFVYVNPENPDVFWRGRGRMPSWFEGLSDADKDAIKAPFDPAVHD